MGFPWYSENDDWDVINESFRPFFRGEESCYVVIDTAVVIFQEKDLKFPNEDNWGDD